VVKNPKGENCLLGRGGSDTSGMLQRVAECCSVLQCADLFAGPRWKRYLWCVAACCNVL